MTRPVIALAGNPNVGKSTLFNSLTGLRQHTGNWSGVTVSCTSGTFCYENQEYTVVDLPGTYSLDTRTAEEQLAKEFILSNRADCIILVCDATCLVRSLHLLKQIEALAPASSLFLCVNLCDEARKKGIVIQFEQLEHTLQIPVLGTEAHNKKSIETLKQALAHTIQTTSTSIKDENSSIPTYATNWEADSLAEQTVSYTKADYRQRETRLDSILTAPLWGSLLMFCLLLLIFWITIVGANYPSALLWNLLHSAESPLYALLSFFHAPIWLKELLISGIYRVISWVVSVMLPPMAIFFPIFTLLEDLGYLPRIAFNLDSAFKKCHACGKQCLTMAMGFGCNAVGVVGCRIIDSPRERLIAILTNSLVPCNGRFPTLLMLISFIFIGNTALSSKYPLMVSFGCAFFLTLLILLGVAMTLMVSWILSKTILKGLPSSFTLELPPYRKPQIKKILLRSLLDRTLFVLGRAIAVAAPAGLILWLMANIGFAQGKLVWMPSLSAMSKILSSTTQIQSILSIVTGFLEPLGTWMGLDGVILTAFFLGFPANEIVVPIILMTYLQAGQLTDFSSTKEILTIFTANGWTIETILCMAIFSLFHWPCSTTCLTIKKETGSLKWTAIAWLLPTCIGVSLCMLIHFIFQLVIG